ncbi:reverse transcriptase domain-containing protein [Tanacetum coccineum]
MLNNMGCSEEIEAMLEIKLYKMGGKEEIFSSEAWRRAFDINERIYTMLCHEIYSAYDFDEIARIENFNAREYWLSISNEEELHFSRSLASSIRSPILRLLQKMITYGLCRKTIRYDKVQRNELWLISRIRKPKSRTNSCSKATTELHAVLLNS